MINLTQLRFTAAIINLLFILSGTLPADIPAGYYDDAEGKIGVELKAALHDIIKDHVKFPYTSSGTDVWDILKETDRDPNNSANVITIYGNWSRNAAAEYNGGSGWNREHVWAKSHGNFGETPPAGTDVHHIRAADVSTNSARGNKDFDNGGTQYVDGDGATDCYSDSDSWEARDAVKGDVARMIFYMAVRYEGENGEPDLELVDQVKSVDLNTTGHGYHGKLSTLMEWHDNDPVDDWERNRNDIIYTDYQHNRNPFIDRPEFVALIWSEIPEAPSNLASISTTKSSARLSWSDNSDNEEGFHIYQDGSLVGTTGVNSTDFLITGLTPNTVYTFIVKAFLAGGESPGIDIQITTLANDYILMSYNAENFSEYPSDDINRMDEFRLIINSVNPDILIAVEIWGENGGYQTMLDNVLNYNESSLYSGAFIDQYAWQDIAVYYKPEFLEILSTKTIDISSSIYLRDAIEVKFRDSISNTEFYVIGVHLKANTSDNINDDINTRSEQTNILRQYLNNLPDDTHVIVAGDFNILNASEPAWVNLAGSQSDNSGCLSDPINQVGEWAGNSDFAPYHTYSTRYSSRYPNSSGLRSRLDYILISPEIQNDTRMDYIEDSYITYGNDGEHFGSSVNYLGNSAVSIDIANALYIAADHLPVFAGFHFACDTTGPDEIANLFFSEYIEGSSYNKALEIVNASDKSVDLSDYAILSNSNNSAWNLTHYSFPADAVLSPGNVWVIAHSGADSTIRNIANDTTRASVVNFNGNDVSALVKIMEGDTTFLDLIGLYNDPDLGDGWDVAGISKATKDHTIVRKSSVRQGNTDWASSAGTNADDSEWIVYDKDTFSYLGTHTITPSSLFGLCNAPDRLDSYRLYPCYPNPFNPTTTIQYDLYKETTVTLSIYDLRGIVVNTLVKEKQNPGTYRVLWNGTNTNNSVVAAGVYLYQLQTIDGFMKTGKMILLK
ncbi:MAG: endonuclease [Candidatus Marinimicrobia bacterium]|nr:endonuclease [Candidatus Neomarinimicrobiota bacterium]